MVECNGPEMRKIADRSDQNYHIWGLYNAVRSVGPPGQGLNSKFGTVSLIFFLLPPWQGQLRVHEFEFGKLSFWKAVERGVEGK